MGTGHTSTIPSAFLGLWLRRWILSVTSPTLPEVDLEVLTRVGQRGLDDLLEEVRGAFRIVLEQRDRVVDRHAAHEVRHQARLARGDARPAMDGPELFPGIRCGSDGYFLPSFLFV